MSDELEEAVESSVERVHQVLVKVKDYLEKKAEGKKGEKLLDEVSTLLDDWEDDDFFLDRGDASILDPTEDDEDDFEDDEDYEDEGDEDDYDLDDE